MDMDDVFDSKMIFLLLDFMSAVWRLIRETQWLLLHPECNGSKWNVYVFAESLQNFTISLFFTVNEYVYMDI